MYIIRKRQFEMSYNEKERLGESDTHRIYWKQEGKKTKAYHACLCKQVVER